MNTQTMTMTETQPAKFSRYRSVRRAAPAIEDYPPTNPTTEAVPVQRAPSRYRRPTQSSPQGAPPLPILLDNRLARSPPQNVAIDSSTAFADTKTSPPAQRYRNRRTDRNEGDRTQQDVVPELVRPSTAMRPPTATRPMTAQSRAYDDAREEARMILEGEYDRLQKLKENQKKSERKLKLAKAAEIQRQAEIAETQRQAQAAEIERQKQAELERQKQTDLEKQKQVEEMEAVRVADAAARHKVNEFFDAPKAQVVRRPTRKENRFITAPQNMVRAPPPKTASPPSNLTKGAAQIDATFDAPVSAVNAGERRVEVRLGGATHGITLPVTPTTNTKDLLNSASIVMSESVDPRTAILIESFSQAGLERPLRRYEHIRDVLNSWDADNQNHLIIMAENECIASDLEKADAPKSQPREVELQMSHSCKPGKWDKRWVILRSDGQVTISKNQNDGEGTNICHLSDFDVYTPTKKQIKRLKPPKKICFAVKSQQKSAMFLEGTNFVHFFATSDKQVADRWYSSVQSWRSWYLANVIGEGAPLVSIKDSSAVRDVRPSTGNSLESIPYQLGSFQPLLDFNIGEMSFGDSATETAPRHSRGHSAHPSKQSFDLGSTRKSLDQRRGSRYHRGPPSSYPTKLLDEARNNVDLGLDSEERGFTGGGLLARSASKRSQNSTAAAATGTSRNSSDDQAFTGGGLLGRSASRRTTQGGVHGSKGKPLVDLVENSEFTDGSLLKQLEAWAPTAQIDTEPKIDRNKYIEADVRVGERF